jgi:FkbM family methyltransferase
MRLISSSLSKIELGNAIPLRVYNRILRSINKTWRVRTDFDAMIDCDLRDFIQSTIFHFGVWERLNTKILTKIITPDSTFIDVGANIGYYTLLAAKYLGDGHVVAIEPSDAIADHLEKNLAINNITRVRVIRSAVGEERGEIAIFAAPRDNIGRTSTRSDSGFVKSGMVPVAPLCELLTGEEMAKCSVIKIDVEGAEVPIVEDFIKNLERFSDKTKLLVEIGDCGNLRWKELFDRLLAAGFKAYDLHNVYEWRRLALASEREPTEIFRLPSSQEDVLFTRQSLNIDAEAHYARPRE